MSKLSGRYKQSKSLYVKHEDVSGTYALIETTDELSDTINTVGDTIAGKAEPWEPSMISLYASGSSGTSTGKYALNTECDSISGDSPITWTTQGYMYLPAGYLYNITLQGGFVTGGRMTMEVYSIRLGDGLFASAVSLHDSDDGLSYYGGNGTSSCTYDLRGVSGSTTIYVNKRYMYGDPYAYGYNTGDRGGTVVTVTQIAKAN